MSATLRAIAAATALVPSIAMAAPVFSESAGDWELKGYVDSADPSNNACVLTFGLADETRVQINVFPKMDGTSNVTMTIFRQDWKTLPSQSGIFATRLFFRSAKYGDSMKSGSAQLTSGKRVIFKGMNTAFVTNFIRADSVAIFAGSADEIDVSLKGTARISGYLNRCRDAVLPSE